MIKYFQSLLLIIFMNVSLHGACSSSKGTATINELSVVSGDYVEIVTLQPVVTTGWNIYACRANQTNKCEMLPISSTTSTTDPNTGRTYYKFGISNGNLNTYQIILRDNSNNPIDFLNATGGSNYSLINTALSGCTSFPYDTTVSPTASNKLIYRGPDGTGDWQIDPTTGNNNNYTEKSTNNNNPVCTIPDLNISKTVDNTYPVVGETIQYTLTVKNIGCRLTTNASISDSLPANLAYASSIYSSGILQSSSSNWTLTASQISPFLYNDVQTITINANITGGSGTTISNTATVTALNDANTTNNTNSVNIYPFKPIADYRFDECSWNGTSGEVKDSYQTHDGTSKGLNNASRVASTIESSILNRSGEFKGEGYTADPNNSWYQARYYLEVPDSDPLSPLSISETGAMSMTGWFKLNNTSGTQTLLHKGGSNQEYRVYVEGGKLKYTVWDMWGNPKTITIETALTSNQFYFFAVTAKLDNWSLLSGGTLTLTAQVKSGLSTYTQTDTFSSFTYNLTKNENLYFGATHWNSGITNFLNGYLDEIKIYDTVLNSSLINSIYTYESSGTNYDGSTRNAPQCSNLLVPIAEYRFDTTTPIDSSSNNLNGTINGGISTGITGQVCSAYHFNGTSAFVSVPDNNLLDMSRVSISAWVRHTSNTFKKWEAILAKGDNAYRLHLNGGCAINNPHTDNGFSYGINGGCSAADIDSNIVPTTNQWYHVVGTYNGSTIKIYVDNILKASASYNGSIASNTFPLYIGANSQQAGRFWTGDIDEVKIFNSALTSEQISTIYTNEKNGLRWDGTPGCQIVTPNPVFTFDAWDSFRSLNDRNISTKIVNKPFSLTIASLNETNNGVQDFNGTVCAKIINNSNQDISGWNKLLFTDQNTSNTTFTLNRAIGGSDSAGVKLYWKKNVDSTCPIIGEDNSTIASDRFSVRPDDFNISASNAVAGVDFNITFTAPIYGAATASSDYNESSGGTFDVTIAEHNASCATGTFNPLPTSFSFINGTKMFTTRYSEVGILDMNISDTIKPCASRYTRIDCDDANVSDGVNFTADLLPIGLTQKSITIIPDHFDVNATLSNADGGTFTYLSTDLNMSAQLDLNITAKNGEGNTTTNYTSGCYSKDTTVTLPHSTVPSPLTKILYHDSITLTDTNITKANPITSTYTASKFTQGLVSPRITFNFDRNSFSPLSPFDFNITSATATDTDGVDGNDTTVGSAKFVYGRARSYDIATNTLPINVPIEFEVYSTTSGGFVSGMPQNVLKWYRNLDHDTAAEGNVTQGGFSAGTTDGAIDTSTNSTNPTNGLQMIEVTSTQDRTIHLDISPWLWYSLNPLKTYNYGTDCTQHPCFNYDYTDASVGVQGVNSGTFQGSDFQMTPAKNITNKGVKLFR